MKHTRDEIVRSLIEPTVAIAAVAICVLVFQEHKVTALQLLALVLGLLLAALLVRLSRVGRCGAYLGAIIVIWLGLMSVKLWMKGEHLYALGYAGSFISCAVLLWRKIFRRSEEA
jgi:hypothetical protein